MRFRRFWGLAATVGLLGSGVAPGPAHADSVRDRQWHLQFMGIAAVHQISQGDGVVVAVADTGVDPQSVELRSAVIPGITTAGTSVGDGREDGRGHGTAMAGLIGARGKGGNNGVLGIAPKSSIMPIRVTLTGRAGTPEDLAQGIEWAIDHGARVISISLVTSDYQPLTDAINRAIKSDIVVVAGVGNTPSTEVGIPARLPGVLAVGGVDRNGDHAAVSVTGPGVMIVAPAVEIVSIGLDARYLTASGTSDATAITAGAVALVRAKYPQLKGPEVIHRLTATAQDKGSPGRDEQYGFGVLDVVKALTADVPPPSPSAGPSGSKAAEAAPDKDSDLPVAVLASVAVGVVLVAFVILLALRRRRV